jgi:N-methylhydantoinase A
MALGSQRDAKAAGCEVTTMTNTTGRYAVGIDVGGTHTDLMLEAPSGLVRSKAFTTHGDYSQGIMSALEGAAGRLGLSTNEVLSDCRAFVNGTTIVTNVLTELHGAKVGVLITRGFRDTFRIARGARILAFDDHVSQAAPPDVVDRDCIEEVDERVNSEGVAVVPLDEDQVRGAVRRLRDQGVEGIAICYLWSFSNPEHERRTEELIAEEFPEAFVTMSSRIHPVIREYERFLTAVFNCMSHRATTRYVEAITAKLDEGGFTGALSFFQGVGGSVGLDTAKKEPVTLLASGPAGGVMGARYLADRLGISNVLVGDMGGTSFDTSVLVDRQPSIAKRWSFGQLETGVNIVDIVSVGSGGGSIAWLDSRGVPQVGPRSAGSEPGPACYGRGGTEPTVTDAMVALGLIDPGNYLRGRHALDVDAARSAIASTLADPLDWTVERAATGIHDLAATNMANALREVTIERGLDPRDFVLFAYGGMLPLFAVQISRLLGCPRVVVPDNSSAFSAYGVLIADYVRQYEQTVGWELNERDRFSEVNAAANEMIRRGLADAETEGIPSTAVEVSRSADLRFAGQTFEVSVPLPDRDLTAQDAEELERQFPAIYERSHGEGTAWKSAPVVLVNYVVKMTSRNPKPRDRELPAGPAAAPVPREHRTVFLPDTGEQATIPVYFEGVIDPGASVHGPAIIDVGDTTVYLPAGAEAVRDQFYGFTIDIGLEGK